MLTEYRLNHRGIMWLGLTFEKWMSQKLSDFENLLYVGDIPRFQSSEIVMLYFKYHTILLDWWDSTCSAANMRLV